MATNSTENLSDSDSDLVDLTEEAKSFPKGNKCFILLSGKTLNVYRNFIDHLKNQVPELTVVDKVEECDFILVFCLSVSRAGTDIEAALQKLQNTSDSKHAVVVVLHHTFDPDYHVPDSSRSVQREKTITVDFLFHEDQGLLQCTNNTESFATIKNCLNIQVPTTSWLSGLTSYFPWCSSCSAASLEDVQYEEITPNREIKCFMFLSGKTLNVDKSLIKDLKKQVPELTVVDKVEECDFILVFCLAVSRAGTDIEAALKKLQNISDTKPAVVVVLHHTFDPDYVAPDSSRSVQREKTITVDFLFHEDQGLLQCTKNTESFIRIIRHLIQAQHSGWFLSEAGQQPSNTDSQPTENLSDSDSDLLDLTEEAKLLPQEPQENKRKQSDETTNEPNVSALSLKRMAL